MIDIRAPHRRHPCWAVLGLTAAAVVVSAPPSGRAQTPAPFRELAPETGLRFVHDNGARGRFYLPEIMGSGVALFDYDGDGDLDVYFVQGGPVETEGAGEPRAAKDRKSRLFRNDLAKDAAGKPVLRFTDVTDAAGVGFTGVGMGAAVADYDNDGDLDLYVTAFGSNVLYRNNGNATFTDVTREAGVDDPRWSTSAAFIDYDRDGSLDLFVANYVDFTVRAGKSCTDPVGAPDYCAPSAYHPVPARLFRNNGNGTFTDTTEAAGTSRAYGAGLGVAVGDYNGDGWPDLYVANDATPNQLWMNRQNGSFEDQGWLSGSAANAAGRPEGSMGIASGDYDTDGDEDLFVTNLSRETFVLYVNDGHGNFEDRRASAGVAQTTASMTGFGTAWLDYDRDGLLDLITANGAVNVSGGRRDAAAPYAQRNQLFHNAGTGRLVDVTANAGSPFETALVGRGLATGDIDNDGDVDVVITANGGPARVLLNESAPAHWLSVSLAAASGNRFGFGARVGTVRQGRPTLWRRVGTDGSYLSASDPVVHFGLGSSPHIDRVVVEWPDGLHEYWPRVEADRRVTLRRGTGTAEARR
jgi:enediyne biosynthesis protein E4